MNHNSLTIIIPNRNRDLKLVQKSLNSVYGQLDDQVQLYLVDYGSELSYQQELEKLLQSFPSITLILCPTQLQLWSKSRSINIVLQQAETTHFMVCDMDMIWHPQFIKEQLSGFSIEQSLYYSVGIMTKDESAKEQSFDEYDIKFKTDEDATGITVFPTQQLKSINGFDEFYHGWGSEDTDVHVRLKNTGYPVTFYDKQVYFKHQWHPKTYRSKESVLPFHAYLERINHSYFTRVGNSNKTKANGVKPWGLPFDLNAYGNLDIPTESINLFATLNDIKAFTHFLSTNILSQVIHLKVTAHPEFKSIKSIAKKAAGKKTPLFITMEQANEMLLEAIILNHHEAPHKYSFDRDSGIIDLYIHINSGS
ncbi:MAG: glycosyltransferase family 2 protein [Nonlabens sp.]|uniref:glycosyltransferase family 2 protein n=1 Tax=Nonlabens sp. TaxID=1888209 RepID=UPI003EF2BB3D